MSHRRTIYTSACFLFLALVLTGCSSLDLLKKPSVEITGVDFSNINLKGLTIIFYAKVSNPYAVPLPLANVDYKLTSRGALFFAGNADLQGTIPAMNKTFIPLPCMIKYKDIFNVLKGAKPGGVVPYTADIGFSVDAPIIGKTRVPVRKKGKLPIPTVPEINIKQIKWGKMSLSEATGVVMLNMVNRNKFPFEISRMNYALSLGGSEVARSALSRKLSFDADGGAGVLEIPISFAPKNIGLGLFRMLMGSGSGYVFSGDMDASTPFGNMTIPLAQKGKTKFSR